MAHSINPLHEKIGNLISNYIENKDDLLKDPACGGEQHIPLFHNQAKSRAAEYCNVDLAIIKNKKIKIIIEIEESNVKPTQICGKFLTSALSKYYIHQNENYPLDPNVTFIQIVDDSKLQEDTQKYTQLKALQQSIRRIIPLDGSSITDYHLIPVNYANFDEQNLFSIIEKPLQKIV
jgi:hypothetical protein